MTREFHVASLIVHGAADSLSAISAAVTKLPGAEVHASDGNGKLVVTLETWSEAEISKRINEIGEFEGVFATSLVYHQVDKVVGAEETGSQT